jgi:hypothetical protein
MNRRRRRDDDGFKLKRRRKKREKSNDAPDQFSQEDFFVRVERLLLSSSRTERERVSFQERKKTLVAASNGK